MKLIKNIEELNGKTIKEVKFINDREYLFFMFDDGSYAFLEDEYCNICFRHDISKDVQYIAGIISRDEYEKFLQLQKLDRERRKESQERERLAALKAKYE